MYVKIDVIDSVTSAAHPINEDVWGFTDTALWVIDGASSVDNKSYFSHDSDARWLGDIATQEFQEVLDSSADSPRLQGAIRAAALAVHRAMSSKAVQDYIPPSAAVTLIELVGKELHYFGLGDVTLAISGERKSFVAENQVGLKTERAWLEKIGSESTGKNPGIMNPYIANELRNRRLTRMNRDGGYWILSDEPKAAEHGWSGHLSIDEDDYVLVASDGFARLITTFQELASWDELIKEARKSSLTSLLQRLRLREQEDPDRSRFPRMSVSDDATAVLAKIGMN